MSRTITLVPAHNEEEQIATTLEALLAQTRPLDRILVVLDNCTDKTEEVALQYPVDVMSTVDNVHKKAGALNQALPHCEGYDYILDTDADSILDPHFVERAVEVIESNPTIGAVSAREGIKTYSGLSIGRRIIYGIVRYQRYLWDTMRMESPDNTMVVVGPGALLRTRAVLDLGGWDNHSLTEDNALSLDLRLAGWRTVLGPKCYVWSDSPLGLRELWKQRVRWGRGYQDSKSRPWRRATLSSKAEHIFQRVLLFWLVLWLALLVNGHIHFGGAWLLPLALMTADRLYRLRLFPKVHLADVICALPPVELVIFAFWQTSLVAAWWQGTFKIQRSW